MSRREEIESIIKDVGEDGITAETIVEKARNARKYPSLNEHLWAVSEEDLAMEARVMRAHKLMYTISVTTGAGERTRLLVHTRGVSGYQTLEKVVSTPDLAAAKLQQLAQDIARARARLRGFRSALPDAVADEVDELLARAEAKAVGKAPEAEAARDVA